MLSNISVCIKMVPKKTLQHLQSPSTKKGLCLDDQAVTVAANASQATCCPEPQSVPDQRNDKISTLQAQITQVLNILNNKEIANM